MNEEKNVSDCWLFNFALESESGEKLDRKNPEELMNMIIKWAEDNNCQIGGGYRKPKEDEFTNPKLY